MKCPYIAPKVPQRVALKCIVAILRTKLDDYQKRSESSISVSAIAELLVIMHIAGSDYSYLMSLLLGIESEYVSGFSPHLLLYLCAEWSRQMLQKLVEVYLLIMIQLNHRRIRLQEVRAARLVVCFCSLLKGTLHSKLALDFF